MSNITVPGQKRVAKKQARPYGDFDKLVRRAEHLIEGYEHVQRTLKTARSGNHDALAHVERAVEYFTTSGLARSIPRLVKEFENDIDEASDGWWDDDCQLLRPVVAQRLARLIGGFPTSNVPNPEAFAGNLLEEVLAAEPTPTVLESACRALLRSKKFMPAISEMLDEITKAEAFWEKAWESTRIGHTYAELLKLRDELAEKKRKADERAAALKVIEAKNRAAFPNGSKVWHPKEPEFGTIIDHSGERLTIQYSPQAAGRYVPRWSYPADEVVRVEPLRDEIAAGDRIIHPKAGCGTVQEVFPVTFGFPRLLVLFDTGFEGKPKEVGRSSQWLAHPVEPQPEPKLIEHKPVEPLVVGVPVPVSVTKGESND